MDPHARVWKLRLTASPPPGPLAGAAAVRLGALLQVSKAEALRWLAALPQTFPRELGAALGRVGISTEAVEAPAAHGRCGRHPRFADVGVCIQCDARICAVCRAQQSEALCRSCSSREHRRSRNRALRVLVLILVGGMAVVWALSVRERHLSRANWRRTLQVAVVLVSRQDVPATVREPARKGLKALEAQLSSEFARYREGPTPFHFQVYGPVRLASEPPNPPPNLGLRERAAAALQTWRFLRKLRSQADLRDPADVTVLVELLPDAVQTVEGVGEAGGDFAMVQAPVGDVASALSLTAIAHEVLHAVGATDKYDSEGHARVPEGLAEPERIPLYPQRFTEVMVGETPLGPQKGKIPVRVDEVRVGPATAKEIHWMERAALNSLDRR